MRFILFIAVVFCSLDVAGQNLRLSEINASIGFFSIHDAETTDDTSRYSTSPWSSEHASPVISASITYFETGWLSLLAGVGFQKASMPKGYGVVDGDTTVEAMEGVSTTAFSFTPGFQLNWLTTSDDKFRLYSNANFGLSIVTKRHDDRTFLNGTYPQPTVHVTAIGMRFGDKLAGFFEIGMGYKGMIGAGLSYRL